jgi:hypothetical protein
MKNTQFSKYIDAVLTQYNAGSISKEVAMQLLQELTPINEEVDMQQQAKRVSVKEYIDNEVKDMLYNLSHIAVDEGEVPERYTVAHVIKYMKSVGWKWLGKEVTEEDFVNHIKRSVKDAVLSVYHDWTTNNNEDAEYQVSSGGITVHAYLDDDFNEGPTKGKIIVVDCSFTMSDWGTTIYLDDMLEKSSIADETIII